METTEIAPNAEILEPLQISIEDENLEKLAKALSSRTRQEILKLLMKKPMDVSKLAAVLKQTEANISAQIQILQKAGLVTSHYEPGGHGVRKICQVAYHKIEIALF
jgi:predicted transcriptional regulator